MAKTAAVPEVVQDIGCLRQTTKDMHQSTERPPWAEESPVFLSNYIHVLAVRDLYEWSQKHEYSGMSATVNHDELGELLSILPHLPWQSEVSTSFQVVNMVTGFKTQLQHSLEGLKVDLDDVPPELAELLNLCKKCQAIMDAAPHVA